MSLNWTLLPHRRSLDKAAVLTLIAVEEKPFSRILQHSLQRAHSVLASESESIYLYGHGVGQNSMGKNSLPFHEQPDAWPAKAGRVS